MEDKILKQIEDEAKKRLPKLWDRMSHEAFIEGAKFGYNIKEHNVWCFAKGKD
jgi:hypothetical protein